MLNNVIKLVALLSLSMLTACAGSSQYSVPVEKATTLAQAEALKFKPSNDSAVLYLYRPWRLNNGAEYSSFRINDKRVGEYISGFYRIELVPGTHEIRSFLPPIEEDLYYAGKTSKYSQIQSREIKVSAGEVIFIEYDGGRNTLKQMNGAQAKPKIREEQMYSGSFAKMTERKITPEDIAWQQCQQAKTLEPCQQFVMHFPNSSYKTSAEKRIEEFALAEQQAKDAARFARDSALPLEVRKDKYMVALTGHLKNSRYEQALPYFKQIEALNVELAPSFDFFYGETLFKLNQPEQAITKFYQYITAAGSNGKYYTKALTLVNEAEALESE